MMSEADFRDLYDACYGQVLRFVRGAVSHPSDVEELVQDVFLRIARSFDGYRGDAALSTWVLAIARNVIVDYWRRQGREAKVRGTSVERDRVEDAEWAAYSETGGQDNPAEVVAQQDELARIRVCIDGLPTGMRLVLLCRLYQDLTTAETAQVLGWTPAHVRVTYSRAIRRFNAVWRSGGDPARSMETAAERGLPG